MKNGEGASHTASDTRERQEAGLGYKHYNPQRIVTSPPMLTRDRDDIGSGGGFGSGCGVDLLEKKKKLYSTRLADESSWSPVMLSSSDVFVMSPDSDSSEEAAPPISPLSAGTSSGIPTGMERCSVETYDHEADRIRREVIQERAEAAVLWAALRVAQRERRREDREDARQLRLAKREGRKEVLRRDRESKKIEKRERVASRVLEKAQGRAVRAAQSREMRAANVTERKAMRQMRRQLIMENKQKERGFGINDSRRVLKQQQQQQSGSKGGKRNSIDATIATAAKTDGNGGGDNSSSNNGGGSGDDGEEGMDVNTGCTDEGGEEVQKNEYDDSDDDEDINDEYVGYQDIDDDEDGPGSNKGANWKTTPARNKRSPTSPCQQSNRQHGHRKKHTNDLAARMENAGKNHRANSTENILVKNSSNDQVAFNRHSGNKNKASGVVTREAAGEGAAAVTTKGNGNRESKRQIASFQLQGFGTSLGLDDDNSDGDDILGYMNKNDHYFYGRGDGDNASDEKDLDMDDELEDSRLDKTWTKQMDSTSFDQRTNRKVEGREGKERIQRQEISLSNQSLGFSVASTTTTAMRNDDRKNECLDIHAASVNASTHRGSSWFAFKEKKDGSRSKKKRTGSSF